MVKVVMHLQELKINNEKLWTPKIGCGHLHQKWLFRRVSNHDWKNFDALDR